MFIGKDSWEKINNVTEWKFKNQSKIWWWNPKGLPGGLELFSMRFIFTTPLTNLKQIHILMKSWQKNKATQITVFKKGAYRDDPIASLLTQF